MTLTFNELRTLKDSLPDGSMQRIAERLGMNVETVRNYFGGANFNQGESVGLHLEPGPGGGVVHVDDDRILRMAREILAEQGGAEQPTN
jgi:hypothetical protein